MNKKLKLNSPETKKTTIVIAIIAIVIILIIGIIIALLPYLINPEQNEVLNTIDSYYAILNSSNLEDSINRTNNALTLTTGPLQERFNLELDTYLEIKKIKDQAAEDFVNDCSSIGGISNCETKKELFLESLKEFDTLYNKEEYTIISKTILDINDSTAKVRVERKFNTANENEKGIVHYILEKSENKWKIKDILIDEVSVSSNLADKNEELQYWKIGLDKLREIVTYDICNPNECKKQDTNLCNGTQKIIKKFNCISGKCTDSEIIEENSYDCNYWEICDQNQCKLQNSFTCDGTTKKSITYSCQQKGCMKNPLISDNNSRDCGWRAIDEPRSLGESITGSYLTITIFSATKVTSYNWKGVSGTTYTRFADNGKTFIFLDVEIENKSSDKKRACAQYNISITDSQKNGYDCSADSSTTDYFECTDLLPGTKKRGKIYAEIPINSTGLIAAYDFGTYDKVLHFGYWDLNNSTNQKNNQINCGYGMKLQNGTCVSSTNSSSNNYSTSPTNTDLTYCGLYQINQDGTCVNCGGKNEIPCKNNTCKYGYELENEICVESCGLFKVKSNGNCISCGSYGEVCCNGTTKCITGDCINGYCELSCGGPLDLCCAGTEKCKQPGYYCTQSGICMRCGEPGYNCCAGNVCNNDSLTYCNSKGICEIKSFT